MPSHVIDSIFFKDMFGSAAMREVFDDVNLLQKWLDYEAALARAEAHCSLIPQAAADEITRQAKAEHMDVAAIKHGIDSTDHPLVTVIWQLAHRCGNDAGHYVHWGATTQDVMDTALVLQLRDALVLIEDTLGKLHDTLASLATKYRDTPMAGRTHGQHALPVTFGFKVAVWLAELKRHGVRLEQCKERVLVGEFGGAVGTLASVADHGLAIQSRLMEELELGIPDIAWHTARDNLAECANIIAMIVATLGKIAHEIIDLQKNEFGEAEEAFAHGKVGSSTMPQKRNPMICEAILTLARLTRHQTGMAIDAMFHEHERDWSSFQMEWAYLPELCVMAHGAMELTLRVLQGLRVYPEAMKRNLDLTQGLLLAERVMLALGQHIGRQEAHDLVHSIAMEAIDNQQLFPDLLKQNDTVRQYLDPERVDALLSPEQYTGLSAVFVDRVVQ